MKYYSAICLMLLPFFGISQALTESTAITITKTWSQEPTGYTYPMDIYVPTSTLPDDGFPVCITLHGNGGVGNVNAWKNSLPNHIIIAPSGYERSWNIADENSDAPDVAMITDLVDVIQTYSNVNPNKIRILGTSNGAAMANRVLIENSDTGVDIVCAIVSHLAEASYHNGDFYYPSGTTGDPAAFEGYDTPITPITGRRYLNISNTNDGVIPYYGGASVVGTTFLDARVAAHIVAQSQGYTGSQTMDSTVVAGADVVYEFKYMDGQVVHLNGDAMHGTNFTQKNYITAFFNTETPVEGALANDTEINITKTWSQEPSGYTYPMDIHVPTSAIPEGGFPVCINLHGNGGVGNVNAWRNTLPNHIIVAPSGYERSWNIADEDSNAPDVAMITDLVDALQTYSNVNPNKIRILGTSNGAGMANRIFIENKDTGVDIICAIVSHLTSANYHSGGFYYPSGETGDGGTGTPPFEGYDTPTVPITGRRYLSISNNNDGLIPYEGGASAVGSTFLDAQESAYIVAQSQGYTGSQVTISTLIDGNVNEFEYLDGQVIHLNGDALHATNDIQKDYVFDYFNREIVIASNCETDINLTTTVVAGTYRSSNEITCNSPLADNATVVFEGNSIRLTDGFIVGLNTTFTAKIEPCSPFQQPVIERTILTTTPYYTANQSSSFNQKELLEIYPNPSHNFVLVQGDFTKDLNYSIHTIQGQEIQIGQLTSNNRQIDLSNLPTNIYFLRVDKQTFKLVKIE